MKAFHWKVKRDLYLRNRPTLKLKCNANQNLCLRKMLLVGHEKLTKIDPGYLPENGFRLNSSGSIALTCGRIWSKESNSSGRVSDLFFQFYCSLIHFEYPYWDYSYRLLKRDNGPPDPGDFLDDGYAQAYLRISSIGPECQNGILIIG